MSISLPTAYRVSVELPYGDLGPLIDWCERNCHNDFRYMEDPIDQLNKWVFFFESEKDYVAFILWKKT